MYPPGAPRAVESNRETAAGLYLVPVKAAFSVTVCPQPTPVTFSVMASVVPVNVPMRVLMVKTTDPQFCVCAGQANAGLEENWVEEVAVTVTVELSVEAKPAQTLSTSSALALSLIHI